MELTLAHNHLMVSCTTASHTPSLTLLPLSLFSSPLPFSSLFPSPLSPFLHHPSFPPSPQDLPPTIGHLKKLHTLVLDENLLSTLPSEVSD